MIRKVGTHSFQLLKKTIKEWSDNQDLGLMSATLSYYAVFSLPGLLLIVIMMAGYFFGTDAVNGKVFQEMREYIGDEGALQVQNMIRAAHAAKRSGIATVIAVCALVYSSTGVMYQLQQALNRIWNVEAKPGKAWLRYLRDRLFSFLMIIVFGFLFILSLVVSSLITSVTDWISMKLFALDTFTLNLIGIGFTLVTDTVIFALIFKILPDVKIHWKHIWVGSLFTAVLFDIGKFVIGFYIARSNPGSAYGAAGSVILILLWVSYSSLIIFFGAIFTKVYVKHMGEITKPEAYAVKTPVHHHDKK